MKIFALLFVIFIAAHGQTDTAKVVECSQSVIYASDAAAFLNKAHSLGCTRVEFDEIGIEDPYRLYIARSTKIVVEK